MKPHEEVSAFPLINGILSSEKICLDVYTSEDMNNEKPRANVDASLSEENLGEFRNIY